VIHRKAYCDSIVQFLKGNLLWQQNKKIGGITLAKDVTTCHSLLYAVSTLVCNRQIEEGAVLLLKCCDHLPSSLYNITNAMVLLQLFLRAHQKAKQWTDFYLSTKQVYPVEQLKQLCAKAFQMFKEETNNRFG